ncbi:DUF6493 family protein [Yinghuangia soli]|uniref:DUF6493 family protein n=1 Tax=Yinghuangia soli TaxID=2908204 RepID=A0AA41PY33_9ACTN|nr:DUF6493 family protein [Yinghuangia soli]MCF2527993.1 DUF6493 family protein [Yinghuangia soli]
MSDTIHTTATTAMTKTTDTSGGRPELTWEALQEAARTSGIGGAVALIGQYGETERRALAPVLKAAAKDLRQEPWDSDWQRRAKRRTLLKVCGAACLGGPAGIVQWLLRADFRWGGQSNPRKHIAAALALRPAEWLPDIAERLAGRLGDTTTTEDWQVVDDLCRELGLGPAEGDGYTIGWLTALERDSANDSLAYKMTADPYTPVMVPRLFTADVLGRRIGATSSWEETHPGRSWPKALRAVSDAGLVPRGSLLDTVLSRLLRGGPAPDVRGFLGVLLALDMTDDEAAERTGVLLRLLPDALGVVAALAQAKLRRLDEAGRLTAEQVAEATRSVLFRPEKKLVRTQFTWLDKAVRQHADHAGELLAAAATVFAQGDGEMDERAMKSFAKHLPKLAEPQAMHVRAELRAALDTLGEPARSQAADLLGEDPSAMPPEDDGFVLPPFVPRELPPEIGSAAELAEEIAALLSAARSRGWSGADVPVDPWALERVVDALLRESARDREALVSALAPVAERYEVTARVTWRGSAVFETEDSVHAMVAAVCQEEERKGWFRRLLGDDGTPAFDKSTVGPQRALLSRLYEVARRLRTPHASGDPYLARPATASGCVDPAALVDGLEEYEAAGRVPWPCDLEQALLRLPRDIDPDVVARADKLGSKAGKWAAEVLAAGGMAAPDISLYPLPRPRPLRGTEDATWSERQYADARGLAVIAGAPAAFENGVLAPALCALANPVEANRAADWWTCQDDVASWALLAPAHRDVVAAWAVMPLALAAENDSGGAEILPLLAEADGPIGPGMRLALAYGLGARTPEDRAYAADAYLTLAARDDGTWDAFELGRTLAGLIHTGLVKPNRLADSLKQVVGAGAYAATWQLMTGLLPELIPGGDCVPAGTRPNAVLGDLLGLAADCASRTHGSGTVAGLAQFAAAKGSSRAVTAARRLHQVLGAPTA